MFNKISSQMLKHIIGSIESLFSIHLFTANWKIYDWLFYFVAIPVFLFIVFELPVGLKETYFILDSSKTTIYSFFLSNYVHSSSQHFSENLYSYLAACFLIFNFEIKKRDFYAYSIFMFLILPWIISIISVSIIGLQTTYQGFSGLVSSLFGYLLYALYKHLKKYCFNNMTITFLYLIVILNIFMVLGNIPSERFHYGLILIIALWLVYMQKDVIDEAINKRFKIMTWLRNLSIFQQVYFIILIAVTLVSVFILPSLVPQNIIHNGAVVNSLAHYAGYFFGVFMPLVLSTITNVLSHRKKIMY